jgi:hypothetical protein
LVSFAAALGEMISLRQTYRSCEGDAPEEDVVLVGLDCDAVEVGRLGDVPELLRR